MARIGTAPLGAALKSAATRRLGLFVLLLGVQFLVFYSEPFSRGVTEPYLRALARVSGAACGLVQDGVTVDGTAILAEGGGGVDVRRGCDGLPACMVYFAATLAYPCPWTVRLLGLLGGFIAIQALNVVRVVSLFWLHGARPELFEGAHVALWQSLMVVVVLVLWSVWEARWAMPAATRAAAVVAAGSTAPAARESPARPR